MKKVFFTPGPSQLHPRIGEFLEKALAGDLASVSHRSETFREIYGRTEKALRTLLQLPDEFVVAFVGSATEAMERILQGTAANHSFHFVNGAFSRRFKQVAEALGLQTMAAEAPEGAACEVPQETLPEKIELACVTHNETSTGVTLPPDFLRCLRERNPDSLLAVDVVSSAPAVPFDYGLVDCAFFSVQKGFGLPAGLGVMLYNLRCASRARVLATRGYYTGSFHGLAQLTTGARTRQTSETPNVLAIHLLGRVAEALLEEGAQRIHEATARKAERLYGALELLPGFEPLVQEEELRSQTVIAVRTHGRAEEVRRRCRDVGLEVGTGYGPFRDDQIRIANFPAHTEQDVERLLSTLRDIDERVPEASSQT